MFYLNYDGRAKPVCHGLNCSIISNHLMLVSNMKMMALFYFILLYKYMKINTYLNY